MLQRLIFLLIVGGLAWLAWRAWQKARARALPRIPDAWRALARRDELAAQALDLWSRLLALTARSPERRALMVDVYQALDSVLDLVARRAELLAHAELLAGDALPAAQAAQQAEVLESIRARGERMHGEARNAVDDLRQVYLDLLAAHETSGGEGRAAIRRTRNTVGEIRRRVAAEQEIRDLERRLEE